MKNQSSVAARILTLTLVLISAISFYEVVTLSQHASPSSLLGQFLGKHPCDQPIHYTVGTFDKRFGITQATFLQTINKAAQIWNTSEGRQVLIYDPAHATLPINLVYDERQQATERLKQLGITIDNTRATYDKLKKQYDGLRAQIDARKPQLDAEVTSYNTRADALSQEIASWNVKGGAPKNVYTQLTERQAALKTEQQKIEQDQKELNGLIDDLNAIVPALNKQATLLNLSGVDYNKAGAPLAQGFEEGVYESDATGTSIDIFQFENRALLESVLAHELGHALGMEHVTDTKAIMYYINSGNAVVTAADKQELERVCGK